jgi:hypothetical protein
MLPLVFPVTDADAVIHQHFRRMPGGTGNVHYVPRVEHVRARAVLVDDAPGVRRVAVVKIGRRPEKGIAPHLAFPQACWNVGMGLRRGRTLDHRRLEIPLRSHRTLLAETKRLPANGKARRTQKLERVAYKT